MDIVGYVPLPLKHTLYCEADNVHGEFNNMYLTDEYVRSFYKPRGNLVELSFQVLLAKFTWAPNNLEPLGRVPVYIIRCTVIIGMMWIEHACSHLATKFPSSPEYLTVV